MAKRKTEMERLGESWLYACHALDISQHDKGRREIFALGWHESKRDTRRMARKRKARTDGK